MREAYAGIERINHLRNRQHWPSAFVTLIYCLAYRTSLLLGISKTELVRRAIDYAVKARRGADQCDPEAVNKRFQSLLPSESEQAKVRDRYAKPIPELFLAPEEALRRLRYFSEDYLNREFDVFLTLLPDIVLDDYFSRFFSVKPGGAWNVVINSPDFEASRSAAFMQPDTLVYNISHGTLIAVELKVDARLQENQILNYCRMAALLEADRLTEPRTEFKILVISADPSRVGSKGEVLITKASSQLAAGHCRGWQCADDEAVRREERTAELLGALELRFCSWHALGEYFDADLKRRHGTGIEQSYTKLVQGFLNALAEKYSFKRASNLYDRKLADGAGQ